MSVTDYCPGCPCAGGPPFTPARLVREFHEAADAPRSDTPNVPDRKREDARVNLAFEEYDEHEREVAEYQAAGPHSGNDGILAGRREHIAKVARELGDAVYIAYGTALEYGVDLDAVILEIHTANMRKVEGGVKKDRTSGKVEKPPGWRPPDVYGVIFGDG